jgi:large subunit ribosomal protein L24
MKLKIKKGATVEVIAGSEKGKRGAVMEIDPKKLRIKIQGVRVRTHFDKKEGLLKKEAFMDYSNVRLIEQAQKKAPTKAAKKVSKKANAAEKTDRD